MLRINRGAQSTAEYAIVIALVIGAVVAMQVYVRRGLQGRMKGAVDTYLIGQTVSAGIPKTTTSGLFEPHELERDVRQKRDSTTKESVSSALGTEGQTKREIVTGTPEVTEVINVPTGFSYEKYKAAQ